KDERWIYQPRLVITTPQQVPAFVAKDFRTEPLISNDDGEGAMNALLYRHAREFATGHGVAAAWNPPTKDGRTTAVFTDFMPTHEVPLLIPPADVTGGAILDMKSLAEATDPNQTIEFLEPMVAAYEAWVAATERASLTPDVQTDAQIRDAAKVNIERCKSCA